VEYGMAPFHIPEIWNLECGLTMPHLSQNALECGIWNGFIPDSGNVEFGMWIEVFFWNALEFGMTSKCCATPLSERVGTWNLEWIRWPFHIPEIWNVECGLDFPVGESLTWTFLFILTALSS
jgi:hypothetical protein